MSTEKNKFRKFGLTSFAVDNGVSILVLIAIIVVFGFRSYNNMAKEMFPEIVIPQVFVNTVYPGNSASEIESLISRPLETELNTISGIKKVTSTSLQDYSVVIAEFETYVDTEEALRKTKDAVDKAKNELPSDLNQEPQVFDVNLSELPIMSVNISGDFSNDELRNYAELLQDELENITEINQVDIKGAREREVKVDVDIPKMEILEINFGDIANAIAMENLTMSGGELVNNGYRRAVRVIGQIEDVKELEDIIVKNEYQKPVFLKDIADVSFGFKDQTSIARSDGFPVISLDVIKRKGSNLLDASDKIKIVTEEVREKSLPENLKVSYFNDQSVNTRRQVDNLENSIISGMILVTLVLLFFLGLRNAIFVGTAIPLSMLTGIMVMSVMGYTLNMIVLFGLILALGMLVDNGIVVVENIYRFVQNKFSNKESSKYGTGEVAVPIITSTITTLAAFIPLAFWPGMVGNFMKYLPITLIIVLTSSLFVALVVNPVLTSYFMREDKIHDDVQKRKRKRRNILLFIAALLVFAFMIHFGGESFYWLRNSMIIVAGITILNYFILRPLAFAFQSYALPWINKIYEQSVRFALKGKMPTIVFLGTIFLFIGSAVMLGLRSPKVEFFPKSPPQYINAFVDLPLGSDITVTDQMMRDIESRIIGAIEEDMDIVESVLTQIGEGTGDPNGFPEPGASPNKARLTVTFIPEEEQNGKSSFDVLNKMRDAVKGVAGVKVVVAPNENGPPTGKPINIEITGEDVDELARLSDDVIKYLEEKNVPGVEELQTDMKLGKPELLVTIDRKAAKRYGVSTFNVANTIRTAVFGEEVSKYKVGEEEYPIQLRVAEKYRNDINAILEQKITFRSMTSGQIHQVPISALAKKEYSSSYNAIKRQDQERIITIYSNVLVGFNANEVVDQLDQYMANYDLPDGYSYKFTGEQQDQMEAMSFLNSAFMLAVFAIFFILVLQFNSIISPFIIILSVVFSTIGVFLGYVTTGADISIIMTGVGIISLAGIVVNNAIVLVDYTNLQIGKKREEIESEGRTKLTKEDIRSSIVTAGSTRLRPVLLTAITTVLGLFPLAIGFNFNFFTFVTDFDPQIFTGGQNAAFWGPMAWTVIYGLIFSTFLTLIVVPAMYYLAFRVKVKVLSWF
jgi:multidrug efflux pump